MRIHFLTTLSFVAMLLFSLHAMAVSEDQPQWPSGSAMGEGMRFMETKRYFERLLDKSQARLLELVPKSYDERLSRSLDALDTEWRKYRDTECETFGSLSGAGGSWPSTHAFECEARLTEHHFRRVRASASCIDRIPGAQREMFTVARCLYQLLPLNSK
jgi:hypothetical protein